VFGGPREELNPREIEELKKWLNGGGRAMLLLGASQEGDGHTNFSFLEEYGISCNTDSVMRTSFHKYMHPKEVFINDGVLVPDIVRKKVSQSNHAYLSLLSYICQTLKTNLISLNYILE
jgi:intraflagellar transport protein 52